MSGAPNIPEPRQMLPYASPRSPRSPWRWLFLGLAVVGVLVLLWMVAVMHRQHEAIREREAAERKLQELLGRSAAGDRPGQTRPSSE
jgi:hypothetical protein